MSEAVEQLARQGFTRLRTGVREPWMLAKIGIGLGAPVGTELWGDEFRVEFDPHNASPGSSIARGRAPFPLHSSSTHGGVSPT